MPETDAAGRFFPWGTRSTEGVAGQPARYRQLPLVNLPITVAGAGDIRPSERADTLTDMDPNPVTPNDLARELGVSPRAIRVYLRSKYGRLAGRNETRWQLDGEQAADVRREFQSRAGR